MKVLCILSVLFLFASCATQISESGLYWGKYSNSLYEYKKNPSKENLLKHKNELIAIISKSKELKLRPPPGLQAELGTIYAEEKETNLAMENFVAEKSTYPESAVMVSTLVNILNNKKVSTK